MTLPTADVRRFYDRLGKWLDTQRLYEDHALDDLIGHARFDQARHVFEFGCGTGLLARRLLADHLPATATYQGSDLSPRMVAIASARLAAYGSRARVTQTDGTIAFPRTDRSADRVICTYVLDLLAEADIAAVLSEAERVLQPEGLVCIVSLTRGHTRLSRALAAGWDAVYRRNAAWVGGCRPIRLLDHLDPDRWQLDYHRVVTAFGLASEVAVARPRPSRHHPPRRSTPGTRS